MQTLTESEVEALEADRKRIEFLERLLAEGRWTGRAMLRWSGTGRGFRLHETSRPRAHRTVRAAIDDAIKNGVREDI